MMMHRGMPTPAQPSHAAEVVELRLALPVDHVRALEAAAGRLEQTVGALVRRAVGDFLQPPATTGFVGRSVGRPAAPRAPTSEDRS